MQSDSNKEQRTTEDDILLTHVLSLDMERDKQLLTLSAAGMGLLGTLLAAKGTGSIAEIVICFGGVFCFVLAIGFLLHAFTLNKAFTLKNMEYEAESSEVSGASESLAKAQQSGALLFYIGAFLSAIFALVTASNSFESTQQDKSRKAQSASTEAHDQRILAIKNSISSLEAKLVSIEEHLRTMPTRARAEPDSDIVKKENSGN